MPLTRTNNIFKIYHKYIRWRGLLNPWGMMVATRIPLSGLSIKARVYDSLKNDLIAGKLRPGEFLQEKKLAERFGVSKTPTREALAELVKDGFIQLIPRKGYWVTPVDPQDVKDKIELRVILEGAAVELAANRISAAELEALEGLILPQPPDGGPVVDREQLEAYSHANNEFHRMVASASGNLSLAKAITKVLEELTRLILLYYSLPSIEETAHDHLELIEALRRRDAKRARTLIERHLGVTRERLLGALWGETAVARAGAVVPAEAAR